MIRTLLISLAAAVALSAALVVAAPSAVTPAAAATPAPIHIAGTGSVGAVNIRSASNTGGAVLGSIPEGATPTYNCFKHDEVVNGVPIWFNVTYNGVTGFYSSAFDDAHYQSDAELTAKYGVPSCNGSSSQSSSSQEDSQPATSPSGGALGVSAASPSTAFYDRTTAVSWAVANYNHQPLIQNNGDCTWYVSQALWAGGLPDSADWTKYSPNGVLGNNLEAAAKALIHGGYSPTDPINPTINATNADDLVRYLVAAGLATKTPITWSDNTTNGAQLGDLIAYDWNHGSDGTIDHVAIVTGYAPGTHFPTVSQHSQNRLNRYWSFDPTSNGWIENAKEYQAADGHGAPQAWLIHIAY